ncbi:hypothetical protein FJZ21_04125 [Candidatus Pacearchaeota archaeon]|nr:hypothetical protein [Candidatus Pacearchaeota archaeon]
MKNKKKALSWKTGLISFGVTLILFFIWGLIVRLFFFEVESILFNQWVFIIFLIAIGWYFEEREKKKIENNEK